MTNSAMTTKQDPCKKFACALQSCLQASDFQEWKCQTVIDALYECCAQNGHRNSSVCSGIKPKTTSSRKSPLKLRHNKIQLDGNI